MTLWICCVVRHVLRCRHCCGVDVSGWIGCADFGCSGICSPGTENRMIKSSGKKAAQTRSLAAMDRTVQTCPIGQLPGDLSVQPLSYCYRGVRPPVEPVRIQAGRRRWTKRGPVPSIRQEGWPKEFARMSGRSTLDAHPAGRTGNAAPSGPMPGRCACVETPGTVAGRVGGILATTAGSRHGPRTLPGRSGPCQVATDIARSRGQPTDEVLA
ncbi:hypothetical protein ABIB25_001752 [Nakamurella sp. UYEF19]